VEVAFRSVCGFKGFANCMPLVLSFLSRLRVLLSILVYLYQNVCLSRQEEFYDYDDRSLQGI
jgi:hypothetical protein